MNWKVKLWLIPSLAGPCRSFPSGFFMHAFPKPRVVLKCEVKDKHPWKNSGVKSNFAYEEVIGNSLLPSIIPKVGSRYYICQGYTLSGNSLFPWQIPDGIS